MTTTITPFMPQHEADWDAWCASSVNGTLLHTRRFLNYHGDRFRDASLLVTSDKGLEGVLPAALEPADPGHVVSHPGATYGGLVHAGRLTGTRMLDAMHAVRDYYRKRGLRRWTYKPVPFIYASSPSGDDLYALSRMGAARTRCDLSCSVDLERPLPRSDRRKRGIRRSRERIAVSGDAALLRDLWGVLEENLLREHGVRPVHSLEEISRLAAAFPAGIQVRCARLDGKVEAGVILFNSTRVWHAQYIASSEKGYAASALDTLFDAVIEESRRAGARYFDFGTSNEDEGRILNEGLFRYKAEFGGGGVAYEQYGMDLA